MAVVEARNAWEGPGFTRIDTETGKPAVGSVRQVLATEALIQQLHREGLIHSSIGATQGKGTTRDGVLAYPEAVCEKQNIWGWTTRQGSSAGR